MQLEIQKLTKGYKGSLPVLRELDWQLGSGETAAILGPSGSGKSTLLNIIGALDSADSGEVRVGREVVGQLGEAALARYRNETVGFVFQLHHLLPQCTILENVLIPTLVRRDVKPAELQERAIELLKAVGLGERLNHRPGELSGGERQRAAVARALINRPALLLADEPTGSLDHGSALRLVDLLLELNRTQGVSLVVVTHSQEVAKRMQRVFQIVDGKLVQS